MAYKLASALAMTLMMACVKALDGALPVGEVVFCRAAITLLPLLAALPWQRRSQGLLRPAVLARHLGRGLSGATSMVLIFVTLACLPLTEAVMLGYAAPLMTLLLARAWRAEPVPAHRWHGALLGAAGVAVALGPQLAPGLQPWSLVRLAGVCAGLGGALAAAVSTLQIRRLAATERPGDIVFYYTLSTAVLGAASVAVQDWALPDARQLALLAGAGVASGLAQLFIARSLRHASASLVAPFEYSTLLWSMLIAWAAFDDAPRLAVLAGGVLVLASGLYAWRREARPAA